MADRSPRSLRSMSDDELAGALTVLAGSIELPGDPGPAFADSVRARLAAQAEGASAIGVARGRRPVARTIDRLRWMPPARRALILAAALVVLGAVAAGAATLGVRGVRIIFGPPPSPTAGPPSPTGSTGPTASSPAPLGSSLVAGDPVSLEDAQARVSYRILVPSEPGLPPPHVYLDTTVPGGAVTLVYPSSTGRPSIGTSGIGLALLEFEGRYTRPLVEKFVLPGASVQDVDVGGSPGFWVSGAPHEFAFVGPDGLIRSSTLRLSGNALLWEEGGVTLRLESELAEARGVRIGGSVR